MKAKVTVEVFDGGNVARNLVSRSKIVEIQPSVVKLFEMMDPKGTKDLLADDIMTNALKVVMVARQGDKMSFEPAHDERGRPTGRSMMEESLGLSLIEHMTKKAV